MAGPRPPAVEEPLYLPLGVGPDYPVSCWGPVGSCESNSSIKIIRNENNLRPIDNYGDHQALVKDRATIRGPAHARERVDGFVQPHLYWFTHNLSSNPFPKPLSQTVLPTPHQNPRPPATARPLMLRLTTSALALVLRFTANLKHCKSFRNSIMERLPK